MCGYPAMMPNSQLDFMLLTDISNVMWNFFKKKPVVYCCSPRDQYLRNIRPGLLNETVKGFPLDDFCLGHAIVVSKVITGEAGSSVEVNVDVISGKSLGIVEV